MGPRSVDPLGSTMGGGELLAIYDKPVAYIHSPSCIIIWEMKQVDHVGLWCQRR